MHHLHQQLATAMHMQLAALKVPLPSNFVHISSDVRICTARLGLGRLGFGFSLAVRRMLTHLSRTMSRLT